jgi:hypothetical protein
MIQSWSIAKHLLRWRARKAFPIYINAPPYTPLSGGGRAINLLCYHLNRLGFDAFIKSAPAGFGAPVPLRYLDDSTEKMHQRRGREPIAVYPEVVAGNPYGAKFVVRYLLNTPGLLTPGAETSFGKDDYFITFAPEHAPKGVRAFDLFMPLVDHSVYFPPPKESPRDGFVLFINRSKPDPTTFPEWLKPFTVVSVSQPRAPTEVADLYRHCRAMVTWERTSAIYEALSCECPVICIGTEHFNQDSYQPRFRNAGIVWGWNEDALRSAMGNISTFRMTLENLEQSLDGRVQQAFDFIVDDVRLRHRQNANSSRTACK